MVRLQEATIFLAMACSALVHVSLAQVGTSTLTGRVVDATSAAIPNARVNVVNQESGAAASIAADNEGIYRAATLIPGTYSVEVRAPGFDPVVRKNVVIQ